jgi:glycosyltransferase involved in cell wall biosynthesis
MFISVVISFRNEEEVIPELIRRLRIVLSQPPVRGYELIFVNDDSTDRSLDLLKAEAASHPEVKIINMSRNFGVSVCVMAGMRHARGDAVVYMDADLQDPPELIPEMIQAWRGEEGVEIVHTVRKKREGEHPLKMFLTRIGYRILRKFSNIDLPENAGDFKLLSRRAVDELVKLDEWSPFLRGLVVWIGFSQARVYYDRGPRYRGRTKFPVHGWKVINNFLSSALISFSDLPLKFSLFLGFITSCGAFCYLVAIFVMKCLGWSLPGWSAIMATMLVLGGAQLMTIGVLGLYINVIFFEAKKRPLYIIKEKIGFDH